MIPQMIPQISPIDLPAQTLSKCLNEDAYIYGPKNFNKSSKYHVTTTCINKQALPFLFFVKFRSCRNGGTFHFWRKKIATNCFSASMHTAYMQFEWIYVVYLEEKKQAPKLPWLRETMIGTTATWHYHPRPQWEPKWYPKSTQYFIHENKNFKQTLQWQVCWTFLTSALLNSLLELRGF